MEATLHALGEIVLKGLPTFFLLILLHFYLKRTFFAPLEKVLAERYEATTGARKQAESAMARAEAKAKEYEEAIRNARTEVYKDNDGALILLQAVLDHLYAIKTSTFKKVQHESSILVDLEGF